MPPVFGVPVCVADPPAAQALNRRQGGEYFVGFCIDSDAVKNIGHDELHWLPLKKDLEF
jgi:hypothetical protein